MKKKGLLVSSLSVLCLSLLALTACGGGGETSNTSTNDTTTTDTNTSTDQTTSEDSFPTINNDENYDKASTTYGEGENLNMRTLFDNQSAPSLDPLEEQHVLVVPFGFTEEQWVERQTQENLDLIRIAFEGTQEEVDEASGWMSVQGYYDMASYGKSKTTFDVVDTWCIYDGAAESLGGGYNAAVYAADWYKEEYAKENHGALGADAQPITYYDADEDGVIDAMWCIYSHSTGNVNSDWWAYVSHYPVRNPVHSNPQVSTFGWAGIDTFEGTVDAHTFTHETGHIYGLADYYDYNSSWAPLGGIDMMDHNVGDHNAFSKFSLGWTNPWVVDKPGQIVLRSFSTSGDCFIIPSGNYNGTAFDEYLMFELVSPNGASEKDYKKGEGYSTPGIRVTHIDARVYSTDRSTYLTDNVEEGVDFRCDNSKFGRSGITPYGSNDFWPSAQGSNTGTSFALITLIESSIKSDNGLTMYNYTADESALFTDGDVFRITDSNNVWSSVYMPSGENLWNKAKVITEWNSNGSQKFTIDETQKMDISLRVNEIVKDEEYGYKALITINTLNGESLE